MSRLGLALWAPMALALTLAGCGTEGPNYARPVPAPTAPAALPAVTPQSYGALQFGMTPDEASRLLQRPLRPLNADEDPACHYLFPDGDPNATFAFMVTAGQVARIDVFSSAVPTAEGARVGDSEAQVLSLYPGAEVQPHKYGGENDHYLVVHDAPRTHALVFETQDGRVSSYRAGKLPEAQFIEGCS